VAFDAPDAAAGPTAVGSLARRLAAVAPRGPYIVVDRVANRLQLRRGDRVHLDAPCSTGTGAILDDPAGHRRWVFDTPPGVHRVVEKRRQPVWIKPDLAFIEEGTPIPGSFSGRRDREALGAFGLYFGDGYIIHGTLYKRLLGRSVSHGCVRLGDDDLEALYRAAPVGTPVYVF
jgi:L,D-transpeptidase YbiS